MRHDQAKPELLSLLHQLLAQYHLEFELYIPRKGWGEGSGNSRHYSCLEKPMDGGAWWAVVHGVAMSQTQLSDFTFTFTFMHWRRKWQPTPVFLPGESQGRGSLVCCHLWGRTELDTTEVTLQQQQKKLSTANRFSLSWERCIEMIVGK